MHPILLKVGAVGVALLLGGSYVVYRSSSQREFIEVEALGGTKSAPVFPESVEMSEYPPEDETSESASGKVFYGSKSGMVFPPEIELPVASQEQSTPSSKLLPGSKARAVFMPEDAQTTKTPTTGAGQGTPQQAPRRAAPALLPGSKSVILVPSEHLIETAPARIPQPTSKVPAQQQAVQP